MTFPVSSCTRVPWGGGTSPLCLPDRLHSYQPTHYAGWYGAGGWWGGRAPLAYEAAEEAVTAET